ncbi:MAG: class I SAM-dependent methyltransferase [bacterium]
MTCCQRQGIEKLFDQKYAKRDLKRYLKKGPGKLTRMLLAAISPEAAPEKTLLDIGGGIGVIPQELLKAGLSQATSVEASVAFVSVAKEEAKRQGFLDRIAIHHGDFVDLAKDIPSADIVTLERVLCCYPDVQALVALSSARAQKIYALVYPREWFVTKVGQLLTNLFMRLTRNPFRFYVHSTEDVNTLLHNNGFGQISYQKTFLWQVVVFQRGIPKSGV